MRLVLDTDVLVAGLRSPTGASRQLLLMLDDGCFEAAVSVSMMLEYEAVLKWANNLQSAGLTVDDIDEFLDSLSMIAIPVSPFFLWRPVLRDPADEHVLETAINGQADAIVTFNQRHFRAASSRFRIEIWQPSAALWRLREEYGDSK